MFWRVHVSVPSDGSTGGVTVDVSGPTRQNKGFSTLRRVYRWCNLIFPVVSDSTTSVSVPSDGSTGGVTNVVAKSLNVQQRFSTLRRVYRWCNLYQVARIASDALFQYPQTGLQVV